MDKAYIYIYISIVLITPVRPFRLLFKGIHYLFRSIYSQWKRMEFKKAANDIIISYPLYLIGGKYIECGKCVFFGSYGILSTWDSFQGEKFTPHIVIGDHVTIGNGFHISAANKIIIGNGVLMGKYVTIVDNSHGNISFEEMCIPPINRHLQIENDVIIEDNVWIGDKVTIAKGVLIGCGSIIGSNSVITKDVPAYSVVAGVPAKIIRELNGK